MTTTLAGPTSSALEVGVGLASRSSDEECLSRAAAIALSRLHGASPDLALIVTAGSPILDATARARSVLGRIQIAGGATAAILTDDGPMKEGALVACVANADGAASGVFNGRIIVRPGAQKTNAQQTNKNLLLSEEALVNTNPQLEIEADDVKCAHGATIGQLDKDALFYLRSRGIGREEATGILTRGFIADLSDRIRIPAVRDAVRRYVFAEAA